MPAARLLSIGWVQTQAGYVIHESEVFILPGILFGIQLSTAYHARHLCYLALCIAHASADRVSGIALYLWFPNRALNVSALLQ